MRHAAQGFEIALSSLLFACEPSHLPTASETSTAPLAVEAVVEPAVIPAWITNPEEFPVNLQGTNNCTFAFGQSVPQWDFHPDAGCWERPGWTTRW